MNNYRDELSPIIKLTENCNYNCNFCRYANRRKNDNGILYKDICSIIEQCVAYNNAHGHNHIKIIFHGGEPLLYGKKRFNDIMSYEREITEKNGTVFKNSVQTNASLIDDEWCGIFQENHIGVGISFDGPDLLNGHYSGNRRNAEAIFLRVTEKLKKQHISYGVLSVITEEHLTRTSDFFNFFINCGVENLGLCYCYSPDRNKSIDPVKLGYFLIELYELYFNSSIRIKIREFDDLTRKVIGKSTTNCVGNCRKSCGRFITVTPNGNVFFCDEYDFDKNKKIGNLNNLNISEMLLSKEYQRHLQISDSFVKRNCVDCSVFNLCQGGCPRSDQGMRYNYFCETYKLLYPYIQKKVQNYLLNRRENNEKNFN